MTWRLLPTPTAASHCSQGGLCTWLVNDIRMPPWRTSVLALQVTRWITGSSSLQQSCGCHDDTNYPGAAAWHTMREGQDTQCYHVGRIGWRWSCSLYCSTFLCSLVLCFCTWYWNDIYFVPVHFDYSHLRNWRCMWTFFEKQPHYMVQLRWALAPSKHVRSSSNLARLDWRVIAEGMVSNLRVIMRFSSLIVVS